MAGIRHRILIAIVSVFVLTNVAVGTQLTATLSGPVLGFMFDSNAHKLRPLQGILGNATVGAPVELGFAISTVLALDAGHVIVSTDARPELVILNLENNPPSAVAIPGIPANPSLSAASVHGTAAAFYYADTQWILIVTGLPHRPAVSHHLEHPQWRPPLTRMAVSNDGTLLVYAVDEGGSEVLYGWTVSSDSPRFLTSAVSVSGLAITGTNAAIVADRGTNEVFAIWHARDQAVRQFLVGSRDGVANPTGVAVSADNRIYIANADSAVIALDSSGRFLKTHHCNCGPTTIYALRDSVFLLKDRVDRTIFLLDTTSSEERILFVPPPRN